MIYKTVKTQLLTEAILDSENTGDFYFSLHLLTCIF